MHNNNFLALYLKIETCNIDNCTTAQFNKILEVN